MNALGDARQILLRTGLAVAVAVAAWLLVGVVAGAANAQTSDAEPPPRLVILARSDNPADALASGPVGGVLGAPVLLTPTHSLHAAAAAALVAIDPDLVVLAGGTAALSEAVEQAAEALGYATRRAAGADRHETAALVSALLAEFSTGRPVLTGTPVTDQIIPGLNAERLQGQTPDGLVADLNARLDALEGANTALTQRVADLEATLAGVTRGGVDGRDTLRFAGMNVQVVNGTGDTDGEPNGLGNVIIGYNAQRSPTAAQRAGSHYLVVGDQHEWTRFGGLLAGLRNTATGDWASVSGGGSSTASGTAASVTGGTLNVASGSRASVSGGSENTASGVSASVSGGTGNTASGLLASVSGGASNTAIGSGASVSGGSSNIASGSLASVLGGSGNTVDTFNGCHPAC